MRDGMRIGFVSLGDASDITTWSGVPYHVLAELRKRAHVEVCPLSGRLKCFVSPARITARLSGRNVTLDHYPLMLRSYARQIRRYFERHPVDVIFSTSSIPVTLLDCEQPIVFWSDAVFHSMCEYYDRAFSGLTDAAVRRGKQQEEMALNRCTIAAYGSAWAANGAQKLTNPEKVRLLPFGSNIPVQHTEDDLAKVARQKRASRRNECELLFVGVDWERKGGDVAVETARLLNESGIKTKLRVIGSQPKNPVPDFVDLLGFMNKSSAEELRKMTELFRAADFFILPTKAEAAGIVFAEASSYGLPILSHATGGVPDYVVNGVNGVCLRAGASAAEFAENIRRILLAPGEYEALAVGGFREYKTRLNWETSVESLLGYCAEALSGKGRSILTADKDSVLT